MINNTWSNKLRFICVALVSCLTITSFSLAAGCAKQEEPDKGGNDTPVNANTSDSGENDNAGESQTEDPRILPSLDDADFEGYEFRILTRTSTAGDWVDWIPRDVYAEEETGDTINDAVYKRNLALEDKYNFKIKQLFTENFSTDIKKAVGAGDDAYDMIEVPMRDAPGFAQAGYFLNLNDLPSLDLDQPWWDQAATSALSIGNSLYFTSGDILMVNNDTCSGIVFNKELLKDLGLEDPYPIVKEGKWTTDKLYDLCKDASSDINGDGEMVYTDDRFGFIGQRDTLISFLHSAGEYIAKKDADDYPYITFGNERSYAAMEGCFKIMYDMSITHNAHHIDGQVPAIYPVSEEMFMSNRALFMWVRLRIVENLRSMDRDFGILPLPKLDANQSDYATDVISYTGCLVTVPVTIEDPERTGHILEAICAESMYTTMPAYYDVTLKTKMARDDDSSAMLDIIFSNRIYDVGEIYNFGDFGWKLIELSMKNDTAVASTFEKLESKMQTAIDRVIIKYDNLDH